MQIVVHLLLAFALQMARICEGGTESEPLTNSECLKETDPMGSTYRGTISQTENGLECQRWDTDEPHRRLQQPDDLDNNYCRNPNPDENSSRLPWCYTNVPGDPRWEYCSIKTCGSCIGVTYENKCFIAYTWESYVDRVDHDRAIAECERHGGFLANIYSQSHMNDIMQYIREAMRSDFIVVRTGMNLDTKSGKLTLRDGSDAADELKWHKGSPSTGRMFTVNTNVVLAVDSDPSSIYQYLDNTHPGAEYDVLCEIK